MQRNPPTCKRIKNKRTDKRKQYQPADGQQSNITMKKKRTQKKTHAQTKKSMHA